MYHARLILYTNLEAVEHSQVDSLVEERNLVEEHNLVVEELEQKKCCNIIMYNCNDHYTT